MLVQQTQTHHVECPQNKRSVMCSSRFDLNKNWSRKRQQHHPSKSTKQVMCLTRGILLVARLEFLTQWGFCQPSFQTLLCKWLGELACWWHGDQWRWQFWCRHNEHRRPQAESYNKQVAFHCNISFLFLQTFCGADSMFYLSFIHCTLRHWHVTDGVVGSWKLSRIFTFHWFHQARQMRLNCCLFSKWQRKLASFKGSFEGGGWGWGWNCAVLKATCVFANANWKLQNYLKVNRIWKRVRFNHRSFGLIITVVESMVPLHEESSWPLCSW